MNVKDVLKKLEKLGFLSNNNMWQCDTVFADFLCFKEAYGNRDYQVIIPVIQSKMEINPWNSGYYDASWRNMRELRFAFFLGHPDNFERFFFETIRWGRGIHTQNSLVEYILGTTPDVNRLAKLPSAIRTFLVSQKILVDTAEMNPQGFYYLWAVDNLNKLDSKYEAVAHSILINVAFLQGKWNDLSAFAKKWGT
ncbi:MAG: hypothetical protein HC817_09490 [Saprospiraceae bacterium]|nr:hypothetical protein [Saprospiraceae bacterium]